MSKNMCPFNTEGVGRGGGEKEGPSNSEYLQNWLPPPKISYPLFNLEKFPKREKSTPRLSRIHSNLMNDKEFRSLKLLKFK